jgi:RNA polymerase sigma factor (sigma-70 family)
LNRFADTRDSTAELAFSELVKRHGPMVLAVCRQILRHSHDADDAFQATFLVLVRKARSIKTGESLAPWLYHVAYRTAHRARAIASRYRTAHERQICREEASPDAATTLDLRPLLYEELGRLPGKYRSPIVLCHLEGRSHEEAARILSWPVGTLSGRLSRGRRLLRTRLERRGVIAPSVVFALPRIVDFPADLTNSLVESTASAATRFAAAQPISTSVFSLAQGVLRTMVFRKLRMISAVLLIGVVSGGAVVWAHRAPASIPSASQTQAMASLTSPSMAATAATLPDRAQRSAPPGPAVAQFSVGDKSQTDCPSDCTSDCPLMSGDGPPPYCPITMAANAITRIVAYFHE